MTSLADASRNSADAGLVRSVLGAGFYPQVHPRFAAPLWKHACCAAEPLLLLLACSLYAPCQAHTGFCRDSSTRVLL